MQMTVEQPKKLDNNFEAIRITAALMVLFSHHFALTGKMEPSFLGLYSLGGLAVYIFFIISGYLVTASWYNDPSFFRFILRRLLRIWPALAVGAVITAYILGAWVTTVPLTEYWMHPITFNYFITTLQIQAPSILPGVFENNPYPRTINGSLWTIPLEVRCYVVLAVCGLLGLMRFKKVWMLLIAAYVIWFLAIKSVDLTGKLSYIHEFSAFFLAGSALFILRKYWQSQFWLWFLMLSVCTALVWASGWHHTAALLLLPFLVVYAGTCSTPIIRNFGRWGDPSYGIYLIAFPVQQTVIHFLWPHLNFWGTMALAAAITVALAYVSWHGIEKRAMKLKPKKR